MTIDVDPVITELGALELRWYGVIMAVAVMVAVWVGSRQLKARNIHPEHALGLAVFGIPLGILGARLVHVIDRWGYYMDNPGEIIGVRLVGLAIYGVVAGGLLGMYLYCRWRKLPTLRVLDATAVAFPVGQIIGKCANIINGDTWGSPTDLPWGITYSHPDAFIPKEYNANPLYDYLGVGGVPTHPTPIYEQIWLVIIVVVLLLTMKRLRKVDGLSILAYVWLYSAGRFVISFWRENEEVFWGLNEAQVIAAVMFFLAPALAYWLIRRSRKKPAVATAGAKKGSGKADASAEKKGKGSGKGSGKASADSAAQKSEKTEAAKSSAQKTATSDAQTKKSKSSTRQKKNRGGKK